MRTVTNIIDACGGREKIVETAGVRPENGLPLLSHWAIRKWVKNGIPEWHWPLVMSLTSTSPDELHAVNEALRADAATPKPTPPQADAA